VDDRDSRSLRIRFRLRGGIGRRGPTAATFGAAASEHTCEWQAAIGSIYAPEEEEEEEEEEESEKDILTSSQGVGSERVS
jgi:hypothetical protein